MVMALLGQSALPRRPCNSILFLAVVDVGTRSGAGVVSIALLGVPVVGLAVSFIVGQEAPSLSLLAGTAAILFSISVVMPRGARA